MTTEQTPKTATGIRVAVMLGGLAGIVILLTMTAGCAPGRTRDTVLLDSRGVSPPPYVEPGDIDRERRPARPEPARPEPRVREEVAEEPLQPLEPIIPEEEPAEPLPPPPEEEEPEPRIPEAPEPELPETELHTHTVRAGESLWSIGQKYDVSYRDIMAYNEIEEGDVLREGRELTIPPGARLREETVREPEAAPASDPAPRPAEVEERELREGDKYTVRRGDSLSVIASDFGVRVNDIKALNDLDSDRIFEGQTLVIPETDAEPEVARTPDTEPDEPDPEPGDPSVDADEELPTPEWELATDELEDEPIPEGERMDTIQHVVLEGETFADIGEMYNVDPNQIRRYNPDLDEADLEGGMNVDVPVY